MYDKNETFEALNALAAAWKAQFDNSPTAPMLWTEKDGDGMAFMDDLAVCPAALVNEEDLHYDVEDLWFGLVDGDEIHIKVFWSYGGKIEFFVVGDDRGCLP